MSFILTQPISPPAGVNGYTVYNIPVPTTTTVTVDSFPDTLQTLKWIVTLIDPIANKMMSYEVLGVNKFGSSLHHNRYSRVGDYVNHVFDLSYSAGSVLVEITNNEPNDIEVSVVRINAQQA